MAVNNALYEKWINLTVSMDPTAKWFIFETKGGIVFTTSAALFLFHKERNLITNFIAMIDPDKKT